MEPGIAAAICIIPLLLIICIIFCVLFLLFRRERKFNEDLAARGNTSQDYRGTLRKMVSNAKNGEAIITTNASTGQQVMLQPTQFEVKGSIMGWVRRGMVADPADPIQVLFQENMDKLVEQRRGMAAQGIITNLPEQSPLNPTSAVDEKPHPSLYPAVEVTSPSAPLAPPQSQPEVPPPSYNEIAEGGKTPYN